MSVEGLEEVREGAIRILVPKAKRIYDAPVFFNPLMRLNRDLSVLTARVLGVKVVLDAFSATGVRGLRYARETEAGEIWMNDISREAFEVLMRNARLNFPDARSARVHGRDSLLVPGKTLIITRDDANGLMSERFRYFDLVDLDPFGSPVEYLDAALRSVRRRGILAITATDTGVLCGAYSKACMKKYLAKPIRGELCHEAGLRILIGTVVRYAAKYDLGVKVLLAYYKDHYFRIFLKLKNGATEALKSLKKLGYLYYVSPGNFEYETAFLPSRGGAYGPMWMGELKDERFICELYDECRGDELIPDKTCGFLGIIKEELDVPFFYDTHALARELGTEVPKLSVLIENLRKAGFKATKTHLSPTAIKTNAGLEDIVKKWNEN